MKTETTETLTDKMRDLKERLISEISDFEQDHDVRFSEVRLVIGKAIADEVVMHATIKPMNIEIIS